MAAICLGLNMLIGFRENNNMIEWMIYFRENNHMIE